MLTEPRTHRFRSMGTTVSLTGPDEPGFAAAAEMLERVFASLDQRFSRFREDSELTAVNARAGRWVELSPEFVEVLDIALDGASRAGGLFDPTVLPALLAAGYDRDFGEMRPGHVHAVESPKAGGRWTEIERRPGGVRVPADVLLDFGGVAKGWAVDRGSEAVETRLSWAVVDAGGDLRVAGTTPDGGLGISVEDPWDREGEVLRLQVDGGALATSSVPSRTWGPGLHQLIDPRTSLPATTGVTQATAWAETCAEAEIRATWLLLGGPWVLDHVPGVLVMDDQRVITNVEHTDPPEWSERIGDELSEVAG
jgi:thiamine biosynthesis lipoprotein